MQEKTLKILIQELKKLSLERKKLKEELLELRLHIYGIKQRIKLLEKVLDAERYALKIRTK